MVDENLVSVINKELRALKSEAETQKENPRLVKVIEILVRLTSLDGPVEEENAPEVAEEAGAADVSAEPKSCAHAALDIYGRCQQCGQCQHTNVRNGTCLTCDQEVSTS